MLELVFIDGQSTKIEYASGAPVYRLRGKLLPLVRLDRDARPRRSAATRASTSWCCRPTGAASAWSWTASSTPKRSWSRRSTARFKDIGMYAGATILGDGKVGADPGRAVAGPPLAPGGRRLGPGERGRHARGARAARRHRATGCWSPRVGDRRVAIPLDTVTRLEEFPRDRIEHVGCREVVQYREQILPLVRLSHLLGAYGEEPDGRHRVGGGLHRGRAQRRAGRRPDRRHRGERRRPPAATPRRTAWSAPR